MSPILVRPVREQLEHDRVIRLLQVRLKRRHEVAVNIDPDNTVPVKIGPVLIYPDLVLTTDGKKLEGTVEVETAESVNHLEAMSQWAHLGRARVPFHLYVPASCVEIARRLALENHVYISELWSFHTIGDQTRFTLVQKAAPPEPARKKPEPSSNAGTAKPKGKVAAGKSSPAKAVKKTVKPAAKKTVKKTAARGKGK